MIAHQMHPVENGHVTSPQGFTAAAAAAAVKTPGRLDVALIASETPCAAAGVFTRNLVVAAPVVVDREALAADPHQVRAVVANAGNANACTGAQGTADARQMQAETATLLGCRPGQVLVLSTGVIGVPLPLARVQAGIRQAATALAPGGGPQAARAIMTTDTWPKEAAVRLALAGGTVTIGGMAKGAGMIHPDMATMLAVITTDARLPAAELDALLRAAVDRSFNRISVDGDSSTNDTVLLLANGAAGVAPAAPADRQRFLEGLTWICTRLAQMIVRDGEGATKFVEIQVAGAPSDAAAHTVANTVATSPLVKTALAGSDANWGRVLAAAGRAGVPFDPLAVSLAVGNPAGPLLPLVAGGMPTAYVEADAAAIFAGDDIVIRLTLGAGGGHSVVWTCDLTADYVAINADYRT